MPSPWGKVLSEAKRMRGAAKRQLLPVIIVAYATPSSVFDFYEIESTFPRGEGIGAAAPLRIIPPLRRPCILPSQ